MSALTRMHPPLNHEAVAAPLTATNRRARRVIVLLSGIITLSVADLLATMAHLPIGMVESNPIARYIIDSTQSMGTLAVFKLTTVAVCVVLLYHLRCSRQGEVAAWTAILILSALTVWWGVASEELTQSPTTNGFPQLNNHTAAGAPGRMLALPAP